MSIEEVENSDSVTYSSMNNNNDNCDNNNHNNNNINAWSILQ